MILPKEYTLYRRDVKHARIRVNENGPVIVIVPLDFTKEDIDSLLIKKRLWIAKQKTFFSKKVKIELGRNQLLLHGNRYHYYYDDKYKFKVVIDHEHRTIRSSKNLLEVSVQEQWYKNLAKRYLVKRTEQLATQLGFSYHRLFIRDQKTKLGNCSKEKNISLNWRLIKAPEFVSDYIIIHELVHTNVMNHSGKFWTLLKSYYPDYKSAIAWLDKYGNSL